MNCVTRTLLLVTIGNAIGEELERRGSDPSSGVGIFLCTNTR
jgi:hypothetical protein